MKQIYYYIFYITILISCDNIATKDDLLVVALDSIRSQVERSSNNHLTFVDIKKLDGLEIQKSTLQYALEFEGNIVVNKDCIWDGYIFNTSIHTEPNLLKIKLGSDLNKKGYAKLIKGDNIPYKGVATFEKYDSGWRIVKVQMEFPESGVFNILRQDSKTLEIKDKENISNDNVGYDYILVVESDEGGDKIFNNEYFDKSNGMEKAIIAYIGMMGGTNCERINADCMSCQLTEYLKIGCQCSENHTDYVKQWFNSSEKLEEIIDRCYQSPGGATFQRNIEKIEIKRVSNTYLAKVQFWELNIRHDLSEVMTNTFKFAVENGKLTPL